MNDMCGSLSLLQVMGSMCIRFEEERTEVSPCRTRGHWVSQGLW